MKPTSNSDEIDLHYQPDTYFRPHKLEQYLLSKVKGAVMRNKLQALFDLGEHAELGNLLASDELSAHNRKILETVHPMFMGGNYLPDTEEGEVEIARISIRSTTFDVTCAYAKKVDGLIHYRIVDEYGGETLQGLSETVTVNPMTLDELTDFFLEAWPLVEVLESNFDNDREAALDFFSADSAFYLDFDRVCRQIVSEHFSEVESEEDNGEPCPFCRHFNSPPAENTCEHICAFVWDGQVEAMRKGVALQAALQALNDLAEITDKGSLVPLILEAEARRNQARADLIKAVSGGVDLEQTLLSLAQAESGSGWSTGGMLSGSGYNVYVPDPAILDALICECEAVIAACAIVIETSDPVMSTLETRRPEQPVEWHRAISGFWSEDQYHSGHIAYYIAQIGAGEWIMEGIERNVELDGLTEEDVEEGRLNDDQLQAMWGMTLDEAQDVEYRKIVAVCSGAAPDASAQEIAAVLYHAVCLAGGKEISELDVSRSLLTGMNAR